MDQQNMQLRAELDRQSALIGMLQSEVYAMGERVRLLAAIAERSQSPAP